MIIVLHTLTMGDAPLPVMADAELPVRNFRYKMAADVQFPVMADLDEFPLPL